MAGLETAITVASTALSAVGAIQQGIAGRNQAEFDAQVAENNALATRQRAAADEAALRREQRRQRGRRLANLGASGITTEGSPSDIFADEAIEAELDIFNLRRNARLQEQGFRSQADADRARGRASRTAGFLGAGSALLSGGNRVFGRRGTTDGGDATGAQTAARPRARRISVSRNVIGAN